MIENKTAIAFSGGIGAVLVLSIIFSFFIVPIDARDNPLIIQSGNSGSGGSTNVTCSSGIICSGTNPISITPYWELLSQNSTILGSNTTATIVNQALGSNTNLNVLASDGTLRAGEALKANSILSGQTVNSLTVGLRKVNTPTGTLSACVFNSVGTCLYTFGTMNIASLTTSMVSYTFTNPLGTYTLSVGEYVGVGGTIAPTGANSVQITATTPNQFDTTNSVVAQYLGGWIDGNTFDLGSTTIAWKLQLVGGGIYIESDFEEKKHLLVTAELRTNGTSSLSIRFNNDTTNNYSLRTTINGVTSALTSKNNCDITNLASIPSGDRLFLVMWIDNNLSTDRKIALGEFGYGLDSGDTTAPNHINFACKWDNTSSQINNVIFNGLPTSDSVITVWGYD